MPSIYIVSSDKALRYWDMNRDSRSYPIVIYPSQFFLVLIKVCGRSDNDLESFVSFINIQKRSKQLTVEKANIILSGISSIIEDVKYQKHIVQSIYDDDIQSIIRNSNDDKALYDNIRLFSQNYLEEELSKSKESLIKTENDLLNEKNNAQEINEARINAESTATVQKVLLEEKKDKICSFAEKKTLFKFRWKCYIAPLLIIFFSLLFILFVLLQIFACNKSWNIVTLLFEYLKKTTFGSGSDGPVYIIDSILFGVIFFFAEKNWKYLLFDEETIHKYKIDLIKKYITKNKLE